MQFQYTVFCSVVVIWTEVYIYGIAYSIGQTLGNLLAFCVILIYIAHLHELKLRVKLIQDKVGISSLFLSPKTTSPLTQPKP